MPGGLAWRLVFPRSFALINMEEDSPAVSGRWSPLSQSKDFSALLHWCGQFFPRRTLYCHDFYFVGRPWAKSRNPLEPPIFVDTASKCDLHSSRYQHTKFRTCMKKLHSFCHLPLYYQNLLTILVFSLSGLPQISD